MEETIIIKQFFYYCAHLLFKSYLQKKKPRYLRNYTHCLLKALDWYCFSIRLTLITWGAAYRWELLHTVCIYGVVEIEQSHQDHQITNESWRPVHPEQCIQYSAHTTNTKSNIFWSAVEQHKYPLLISFPAAPQMILYYYQTGYCEFEQIHTLFFCKELPCTVSN